MNNCNLQTHKYQYQYCHPSFWTSFFFEITREFWETVECAVFLGFVRLDTHQPGQVFLLKYLYICTVLYHETQPGDIK